MSKKYNGHPSYNHWNVSLWLFNDENLYSMVKHALRISATKEEAAERLLGVLPKTTPDGVPYTKTTVRYALIRSV